LDFLLAQQLALCQKELYTTCMGWLFLDRKHPKESSLNRTKKVVLVSGFKELEDLFLFRLRTKG
jgi:hypothetical protein